MYIYIIYLYRKRDIYLTALADKSEGLTLHPPPHITLKHQEARQGRECSSSLRGCVSHSGASIAPLAGSSIGRILHDKVVAFHVLELSKFTQTPHTPHLPVSSCTKVPRSPRRGQRYGKYDKAASAGVPARSFCTFSTSFR